MNHAKAPPAPGDGAIDLWGHHIALTTQIAVMVGLLLVAGYFLLFPRVAHTMRRLGLSALIAGAASAVYVGWHDHAHHAAVAAAAVTGPNTVPKSLLDGWAGLTLAGTVALFAGSTWWLGKRRQGRFQLRGGRDAGTVYLPGAGRPAGRPPGYQADDPYGGLPPGFPPGFGGRR